MEDSILDEMYGEFECQAWEPVVFSDEKAVKTLLDNEVVSFVLADDTVVHLKFIRDVLMGEYVNKSGRHELFYYYESKGRTGKELIQWLLECAQELDPEDLVGFTFKEWY